VGEKGKYLGVVEEENRIERRHVQICHMTTITTADIMNIIVDRLNRGPGVRLSTNRERSVGKAVEIRN
jgi:hypothetical protein